jgi:hypothetical protein
MPYLHENDEPGQCPLINRVEEVPLSKDSGIRISNTLTLIEDGPHLIRSFTVEHWGMNLTPSFEINDTQYVSCEVAVRTYGFEDICAGLADMLKCQISIDVEYKELQSRIEKADSLLVVLQEKFKVECCQSESKQEVTI